MILLLTATVRPQGVPGLTLLDAELRLQQYRDSLRFWAGLRSSKFDRIILAENSLSYEELSSLFSDFNDARILLVSVGPPSADAVSRGKGACEADLIAKAMRSPELIELQGFVWKCTGRLRVTNFATTTCRLSQGRVMTYDIPRDQSNWADSRLFGAPVDVMTHFADLAVVSVNEEQGTDLESVLAKWAGIAGPGGTANLRCKPRFSGQSGTTGTLYAASRRDRWLRQPAEIAYRALVRTGIGRRLC
ncbi:hypothetical protein GCM10023162_16460 [Klenkia terrae]